MEIGQYKLGDREFKVRYGYCDCGGGFVNPNNKYSLYAHQKTRTAMTSLSALTEGIWLEDPSSHSALLPSKLTATLSKSTLAALTAISCSSHKLK